MSNALHTTLLIVYNIFGHLGTMLAQLTNNSSLQLPTILSIEQRHCFQAIKQTAKVLPIR